VIEGMRACLKSVYGSPDLLGRSVVVQGVGSVGHQVVQRLVEAGARVRVSDLNQEALEQISNAYDVAIVPAETVSQQQVDVYCPCALGAVLNDETVPQLQCRIICGSANNQLQEARHGDWLTQRNILYAPDYIVNSGGALTHLDTMHPDGFNEQRVAASIAGIYETMERVIAIAQEQQVPMHRAADLLAEEHLASRLR